MRMKFLLLLTFLAASFPLPSIAMGFKGTIDFTAEEKAAHQRHYGTVTRVARRYLEDIWRDHLAFHRRWRVSKYYGDRSQLLNTRENVSPLYSERALPPHWLINSNQRAVSASLSKD